MKGKRVICYMGILLLASVAFGANLSEAPRNDMIGKPVMSVDNGDIVNNGAVSPAYGVSYIQTKDVAFGEIDTVGSTTYDWQFNGPALSRIAFDPNNSFVHLVWIWSDEANPWDDRQVYYNCYDPDTGWVFGQGMDRGTACQTTRSGYPTVDVLSDGRAVVALHRGTGPTSAVGVDIAVGLGIFDFVQLSPDNVIWPRVGVTGNDSICVVAQHGDNDEVYYAYSTDFGSTWSDLIYYGVSRSGQNCFTSKVSDKACMMWTRDFQEPTFNSHVMYSVSNDGGQSWGRETDVMDAIPSPEGNTYEWYMTRHADFGGWGLFNAEDELHIVFSASYGTRTGPGYYFPFLRNLIWHYSVEKGVVSLVASSTPADYPEGVGTLNAYGNSYLACKPSLAEDGSGYLYCVWQEFPPDHWDIATAYPADVEVYTSRSMDDGATWGPQVNLTMTESLQEVCPTVAHFANDTLHIIYQHDLGLGSYVQDEGPMTDNPYIYHKVPVIPGDIEVVSIDDPPHYPDTTSYSGETYTPKVTYHNKGTETVTFQARFEVESPSYYSVLNEDQDTVMVRNGFYYDIVEVTLDGDATTQTEFASFYLDPEVLTDPALGFKAFLYYNAKACLLGDTDISDNTIVDSCRVDTIWVEGIEESEDIHRLAVDISPNPSLGRTSISYTLPRDGAVNIKVFDSAGRLIRHYGKNTTAGKHTLEWDGRDMNELTVPSGVYFVKVISNDGEIGGRLILIR
ncbi:hypothetical protein CH333_03470 [candidate division WOR-3 bacterium JGI_Cruoil_03_44_89]|uniref:FlgD/Vpr Ig-like domain-containing protein n=1 Tax=candidate division WOR-3 bacterium JGI_Cruoil_03_44_89 TaxID=1973748 RepID=A0A235BW04_UNCW3|nr:MAG: hypothetical protein CH333_03470 [candidate division WOR-3 bacterium JGI_Cruoil_03_44_89]